jgi:hypothetical protein
MADEMQSAGRKGSVLWSAGAGKDDENPPDPPETPKPDRDGPAVPDSRYRDPRVREVEDADREDLAELSGMLRRHFDPILEEPVPDRLKEILRRGRPGAKPGSSGTGSNGASSKGKPDPGGKGAPGSGSKGRSGKH